MFSLLFLLCSIRIICWGRNAIATASSVPLFLIDGEVKTSLNKNSGQRTPQMPQLAKKLAPNGRLIDGVGVDHRWKAQGRTDGGHLRTLLWHLTNDHHRQAPMGDHFTAKDIGHTIYRTGSVDKRAKNANGTIMEEYKTTGTDSGALKNGTDATPFFFVKRIKFMHEKRQKNGHTAEQHMEQKKMQKLSTGKTKKNNKLFQYHSTNKSRCETMPSSSSTTTFPALVGPITLAKTGPTTTVTTMAPTTVVAMTPIAVVKMAPAVVPAITATTMPSTTVVKMASTTVAIMTPTTVATTTKLATLMAPQHPVGGKDLAKEWQMINSGNTGPPAISPRSPGTSVTTGQQLANGAKQWPKKGGHRQQKIKEKMPKKSTNKNNRKVLLLRRIFKTGHEISRENGSDSVVMNSSKNATKVGPKQSAGAITVPPPMENHKTERWNDGGTSGNRSANTAARPQDGCQQMVDRGTQLDGCQLVGPQLGSTNCGPPSCQCQKGTSRGAIDGGAGGGGECFPRSSTTTTAAGEQQLLVLIESDVMNGRSAEPFVAPATVGNCHQTAAYYQSSSVCQNGADGGCDQQQKQQQRQSHNSRQMGPIVFPALQKLEGQK